MKKYKKILIIFLTLTILSLTITNVSATTEKITINGKNDYTTFNGWTTKTITEKFIIKHQVKKNTGYLTIKTRNGKIKIQSIKVKQGNGYKGFHWKTYKIKNKNKISLKLTKNNIANVYQEGNWGKTTYIIKYKK